MYKLLNQRAFSLNRQQSLSLLGLTNDATEQEIKSTYNTLALRYHPDTSKLDQATTKRMFNQITEAKDFLLSQVGQYNPKTYTQTYTYEDLKARQDQDKQKQQWYQEQQNYYRQQYDHAWENHKQKWQDAETVDNLSVWDDFKKIAFGFGLFSFFSMLAYYTKPEKREQQYRMPVERPTKPPRMTIQGKHKRQYVLRDHKSTEILQWNDEVGPHRRYLRLTHPSIKMEPMYQCLTCNVVAKRSYIYLHVADYEHRKTFNEHIKFRKREAKEKLRKQQAG